MSIIQLSDSVVRGPAGPSSKTTITRKCSKAHLSSSERYLTLHILDTDPQMKNTNNNKESSDEISLYSQAKSF